MTVRLLSLDFDDLTLVQAAERIGCRPAGAPMAYVVTPNADHLVRVARDPSLHEIYRKAELCLLDSRVVGGLARLLGLPTPRVVTGSDLTEYLLLHCVHPHERMTIIGFDPGCIPRLIARYGIAPPAQHVPPFGFGMDPAAVEEAVAFVRAHPARLVFLAVGSPQQEYLAAALMQCGGITGTALCIGTSLDFLAGRQRRAPKVMQRCGLEWLFRLATQPRRLARRYLVHSPAVIALLMRQRRASQALP